jgi:hypothetical protein
MPPDASLDAPATRAEYAGLVAEMRWWRRCALLLLGSGLIAIGIGARGAGAGKVVEATEFVLRGEDGQVHARLGFDEQGSAGLRLLDAGGKLRLAMMIHKRGEPMIGLLDRADRPRILIGLDADGDHPMVSVLGRDRKTGIGLWTDPGPGNEEDHASLKLMGKDSIPRGTISVVRDMVYLLVFGKGGEQKVMLGSGLDGGASLTLLDAEGGVLLRVPSDAAKGKAADAPPATEPKKSK